MECYGMTRYGGPYGQGTIYRMTHAGEVTFLHDFAGGASDGVVPQETLTQATDGNFYGVTGGGGAFNRGTAFRMTPAGAVTILHHFAGGPSDGARPGAALVQAPDGNFYGTTNFGGALGYGTVFRMTPDGTVTVLRSMYAFDGDYSLLWLARLTVGADGELYGVHPSNTDGPRGSEIFRIAPDGSYTVLHAFQHSVDGWPHGALALADDGNLYGWSTYGVFRITPSGRYTLVHARTPWEVGYPGGLLQTSDGDLYASTSASDVQQWGSVFRLRGLECPYSHTASPSQVSVGGSGGATVIAIATRPGCSWTPSSTAPWLTVLDSGTRTGSGTFTVVVAPRRGSGTRTGFLTGGGATLALTVTQAAGGGRPYDLSRWNLDGDRRTDIAVWRPGNGTWFTLHSTTLGEWSSPTWGTGAANDRPVPGDYDGDGRGDPAVWRPGNGFWYILTSRSNYTASMWIQWGTGGENDVPVPADYDGDGATDVAVWRPGTGTWYVKTSSRGFTGSFNVDWGQGSLGDRPVVADYDGDGRADLAVYRPSAGMWYFLLSHINYSRSHPFIRQWGGAAGDEPLVGDFDGDGMSDLGIWRPSLARWYLLLSSANFLYAHARGCFPGRGTGGGRAPDGRLRRRRAHRSRALAAFYRPLVHPALDHELRRQGNCVLGERGGAGRADSATVTNDKDPLRRPVRPRGRRSPCPSCNRRRASAVRHAARICRRSRPGTSLRTSSRRRRELLRDYTEWWPFQQWYGVQSDARRRCDRALFLYRRHRRPRSISGADTG